MFGLNKKIKMLDGLIYKYSEERLIEQDSQQKRKIDRTIIQLNNQKIKIQKFNSEIEENSQNDI